MVNQTLARRYAIAVARLAREQEAVERVSGDLQMLAGMIGSPGLINDFFESPVIDRPFKERVLGEAFEGKVHPIALHALLLLVRKRREVLLKTIVAEYLSARAGGARRRDAPAGVGEKARHRRALATGGEARIALRKEVRGYRGRRSATHRRFAHHDGRSPNRRLHLRTPQRARSRTLPGHVTH